MTNPSVVARVVIEATLLDVFTGCSGSHEDSAGAAASGAIGGSAGVGASGAGLGGGGGNAIFDAELYGIHEAVIDHATRYANPFQDVMLDATFISPSGKKIAFFGFYDGDGSGGRREASGRFASCPTRRGRGRFDWAFSDGSGTGSGTFRVGDTGISGTGSTGPEQPAVPGPLPLQSNDWVYANVLRNTDQVPGWGGLSWGVSEY